MVNLESFFFKPFYFFIILIFFVLLYFYYIKLSSINKKYKLSLVFLRLFSILIILIFLFNPVFVSNVKDSSFNLTFLIDNSKSMKNWDNSKNLVNKIDKFSQKFNDAVNFDYYFFGDSLRNVYDLSLLNYSDNNSNFYNLLSNISKINSDEYILITDGIHTSGFKYDESFIKDSKINVWGLGSAESLEDISIIDCEIDSLIDEKFLINIKIESELLNKIPFSLYLLNKANNLNIYNDKLNSGEFIQNFKFEVDKDKFFKNNIIILESEIADINKNNNFYNLLIDDEMMNEKKFLMLSGALSFNTKSIKRIVSNKNIKYEHYFKLSNNKWNKNIENIVLNDYDLVIFDNFPLNDYDIIFLKNNNELLVEKIIYFMGDVSKENILSINDFLKDYNYSVSIKKEFQVNEVGNKFISKNLSILLNKIPKSKTNIAVTKLDKTTKHNNIEYLNNNLLLELNSNKLFVFIPDLSKLSNQVNSLEKKDIYKDVIKYYINKLSNKNDIDIYSNKNTYDLNEDCIIYFDHINNIKDFKLIVESLENNQKTIYTKSKLIDGIHRLKLDFESTGKYKISLDVKLENGLLLNSNELFIDIILNSYEIINKDFDENLLKKIAYDNNGVYQHLDDLNLFINSFSITDKNKIIKNRFNVFSFDKFWLLLIFALLLEWFLRKNKGLL